MPQQLPPDREQRLVEEFRKCVRRVIAIGDYELTINVELRSDEAYEAGWPESDVWPHLE